MNDVTTSGGVAARVVERLTSTIGAQRYALWFDRTARMEHDPERGVLRVKVPSQFVADWIDKHFRQELREALTQAAGEGAVLGGGEGTIEVRVDAGAFEEGEKPTHSNASASAGGVGVV